MPKIYPISEESKKSLEQLLKQAKNKGEFQRVQCLWLRASLDLKSSAIATALGWNPGSVKKLWSLYFNKGESVLIGKGKGGRRRQNLSLEEEKRVLADFQKKAIVGGVLVVWEIKAAYEKAVGHKVPKSTIYRMLARHGWRKISPRPRHPKSSKTTEESFKKTF